MASISHSRRAAWAGMYEIDSYLDTGEKVSLKSVPCTCVKPFATSLALKRPSALITYLHLHLIGLLSWGSDTNFQVPISMRLLYSSFDAASHFLRSAVLSACFNVWGSSWKAYISMLPIFSGSGLGLPGSGVSPPEAVSYLISVKSKLRYPIIQAIRSQWESQDLLTLLGQSVPCDGWHSISGTRVQHMCTKLGIRAQGLIIRVIASWQLTDNTGICSIQLTPLLMHSLCSWSIAPSAAASTQYSY